MFILQIGANVSKLAWYELNKDFITEWFCVNKDKPELHCQGKCHLKKQLQSEENEKDIAVEISEIIWISFVPEGYASLLVSEQTAVGFASSFSERSDYDSHLSGVFHPPQYSFCQHC